MEDLEEIIRIESPDVDVRQIMGDIEERLRKRTHLPPEMSWEELEEWGRKVEAPLYADPLHELCLAIEYARHHAPVSAEHPVSSGKPVIGPLVVLAKRAARKFLRLYLDQVFSPQSAFNREMLGILENIREILVEERALNDCAGFDRLAYYETWGEDFGVVCDRLRDLVDLFPVEAKITNLYAGRGEFLHVCREKGREALGVEEDAMLVSRAREMGLRVEHLSPREFLERTPAGGLKAAFVYEFGERMQPHELHRNVELLGEKLGKGAELVILNHYPRSLLGNEAAYRDPTILRLVHPESMHFLLARAHFQKVEITTRGQDDLGVLREEVGGLLERWEKKKAGARRMAEELLSPAFYLVEARR